MKKILSIDGGGIRGLIPALVLAELESRTGQSIAKSFDLIAGTSTGGILALGLSLDDGRGSAKYPASALADIYAKRGQEIFPRSLWKNVSSVGGLADELYPHAGLEALLEEYFGDEPLGAGLTRAMVTSYDIQNREPVIFKNWQDGFKSVLTRHAARATSAAPTFFEPALVPIAGSVRALVDGAVFVNSPCVSAYAEARTIFPDEKDFVVVSLGTGELNRPIGYDEAREWGKVGWLQPVLSCMFDGMADAATYQMKAFLGKNYVRLQTDLSRASDDMDNVTVGNIENLQYEAGKLIKAQQWELNELCKLLSH